MKKSETREFLERIKQHYQDFIVDDYKASEWHSILKDYSYQDVSQKFEEHIRSEQYGQYIPKVAFLVKYLEKESDKGQIKIEYLECPICKEVMAHTEFDNHYGRCSSIRYINQQCIKYNGNSVDTTRLKQMNNDEFAEYYHKILEFVYRNTDSEIEKKILGHILYNSEISLQQVIKM